MSDKYSSAEIAKDATAFADSRFGKHYLKRLREAHKRALSEVQDKTLTRDYRLTRADQAAAIRSELDYFATARAVNDPRLLQSLRDKWKGGREPSIDL